jgi:phage terminase large subunit-like protein
MVRADRVLAAQVKIVPSSRRIIHTASGSVYRAIPSDAPSAHGFDASTIIADELHAWEGGDLWDALSTSTGARAQPLTCAISTAGWDRESVCYEVRRYAEQVRDGVIADPTFLPLIYSAPADADWLDEDVWRLANPALDDFRELDEMRTAARQAIAVPARQNAFRRLYLSQWVDAAECWISAPAWEACALPAIDAVALEGRECVGGLDLSSRKDLSAFVLVFRDGDTYTVLPHFWMPAENLREREARDRAPYTEWIRLGLIEATPGNIIDQTAIHARIHALRARYRIAQIGFDPWGAAMLASALLAEGAPMVEVPQNMKTLSEPTKEFEALVLSRRLRHGGHPVLRWMVAATVIREDSNGNFKPDKQRTASRIDGVVATLIALSLAMVPSAYTSVYESRGVLTLDW